MLKMSAVLTKLIIKAIAPIVFVQLLNFTMLAWETSVMVNGSLSVPCRLTLWTV